MKIKNRPGSTNVVDSRKRESAFTTKNQQYQSIGSLYERQLGIGRVVGDALVIRDFFTRDGAWESLRSRMIKDQMGVVEDRIWDKKHKGIRPASISVSSGATKYKSPPNPYDTMSLNQILTEYATRKSKNYGG